MNRIRKSTIASLLILILLCMAACSGGEKTADNTDPEVPETTVQQESGTVENNAEEPADEKESTMKLTIKNTEVNVSWENNESVRALAKMAENGPVTIETEPYGGFEQVGSIGATLPSNDTNIRTEAGDIMLYTSSQMVIFYGSNSWAYTRLGKITDKSDSELRELLSGYGVTVTITAE